MEKIPLHNLLCDVLKKATSSDIVHCYYEPPASIQMVYPCIVYTLDRPINRYADNKRFKIYKSYTVTVIDTDPDSEIPEELQKIPYCTLNSIFSTEGLKHFVHTLYYDGDRFKEE